MEEVAIGTECVSSVQDTFYLQQKQRGGVKMIGNSDHNHRGHIAQTFLGGLF